MGHLLFVSHSHGYQENLVVQTVEKNRAGLGLDCHSGACAGTTSLVCEQGPQEDVPQRLVCRCNKIAWEEGCGILVQTKWLSVLKGAFEQFKGLKLMTCGPGAALDWFCWEQTVFTSKPELVSILQRGKLKPSSQCPPPPTGTTKSGFGFLLRTPLKDEGP